MSKHLTICDSITMMPSYHVPVPKHDSINPSGLTTYSPRLSMSTTHSPTFSMLDMSRPPPTFISPRGETAYYSSSRESHNSHFSSSTPYSYRSTTMRVPTLDKRAADPTSNLVSPKRLKVAAGCSSGLVNSRAHRRLGTRRISRVGAARRGAAQTTGQIGPVRSTVGKPDCSGCFRGRTQSVFSDFNPDTAWYPDFSGVPALAVPRGEICLPPSPPQTSGACAYAAEVVHPHQPLYSGITHTASAHCTHSDQVKHQLLSISHISDTPSVTPVVASSGLSGPSDLLSHEDHPTSSTSSGESSEAYDSDISDASYLSDSFTSSGGSSEGHSSESFRTYFSSCGYTASGDTSEGHNSDISACSLVKAPQLSQAEVKEVIVQEIKAYLGKFSDSPSADISGPRAEDHSKSRSRSSSSSSKSAYDGPTNRCNLCHSDEHPGKDCTAEFTKDQLVSLTRERWLCYLCLQPGHRAFECPLKEWCPGVICHQEQCSSVPHCSKLCTMLPNPKSD